MSEKSLLERTQALIQEASAEGVTNLEIYKATNLRPWWISRLKTGDLPGASVTRVQTLHDYLSARKSTNWK